MCWKTCSPQRRCKVVSAVGRWWSVFSESYFALLNWVVFYLVNTQIAGEFWPAGGDVCKNGSMRVSLQPCSHLYYYEKVCSAADAQVINFCLKLCELLKFVATRIEINGGIEEGRFLEVAGAWFFSLVASLVPCNLRTCQTPTGWLLGLSPEDV